MIDENWTIREARKRGLTVSECWVMREARKRGTKDAQLGVRSKLYAEFFAESTLPHRRIEVEVYDRAWAAETIRLAGL